MSERSKSLLLLEAFKKTKAQEIAGIPKELIEKEKKFKENINKYQLEINRLKKLPPDIRLNKIIISEKRLLEEKKAYEAFVLELEQNYHKYYQLKYERNVVDLNSIRSMLAPEQMLIEYFISDEFVYIFKITATLFEMKVSPLSIDLGKKVGDFRSSIYSYYLESRERSPEDWEKYQKKYEEIGYELYQYLLEPILVDAKENRLVIILAGVLGYLPFEALLTELRCTPLAGPI